jgi:hypothetical protein
MQDATEETAYKTHTTPLFFPRQTYIRQDRHALLPDPHAFVGWLATFPSPILTPIPKKTGAFSIIDGEVQGKENLYLYGVCRTRTHIRVCNATRSPQLLEPQYELVLHLGGQRKAQDMPLPRWRCLLRCSFLFFFPSFLTRKKTLIRPTKDEKERCACKVLGKG